MRQDLKKEQTLRYNAEVALSTANDRIQENERNSRKLEANLNRLSAADDSANRNAASLEAENRRLMLRIGELEANNSALARSTNMPRSFHQSDHDRVAALQHQVLELEQSCRQHSAELRTTAERLQRAQAHATRHDNELLAAQKKHQAELTDLQDQLRDAEDELSYMRGNAGTDASREGQLLRRIEEEEARVLSLERIVQEQSEEIRKKGSADRLLAASQRKLEQSTSRVEELQSLVQRLKQDAGTADSQAQDERDRAHALSQQLSELQRKHRMVIQDREYVQVIIYHSTLA